MLLKSSNSLPSAGQADWTEVLKNTDQPIAIQNDAGEYVFANPRFLTLVPDLASDTAQLLGKTDWNIFDSAAATKICNATKSVWASRAPLRWTQTVVHQPPRDTSRLPKEQQLQFQAFLIGNPAGSGSLLCLMARASNASADEQFLALLSHELRSPLNAMVGWLQVMNSPRATASTSTRALSGLDSAVQRQRRLAEQLLDASQIFSGRIGLDMTAVPIEPLLQRLVEERLTLATEKGVSIELIAIDPTLMVSADPKRLRESLGYILDSVILRTPIGRPMRLVVNPDARQIEIEISSRDLVEPPAESAGTALAKQNHPNEVSGYLGPGIGLAISKALIELQGGTLALALSGKGTAVLVSMRLPRADRPDDSEHLPGFAA